MIHKRRNPPKAPPTPWYRGADIPMRVIRRFARHVAERFRPDKIVLFGSYAYGSPHADSDVDILLLDLLLPHHSSLSRYRRGLRFLTGFSVDPRYPLLHTTKRQAASALRWAGQVRDACRTILHPRPPRPRRR